MRKNIFGAKFDGTFHRIPIKKRGEVRNLTDIHTTLKLSNTRTMFRSNKQLRDEIDRIRKEAAEMNDQGWLKIAMRDKEFKELEEQNAQLKDDLSGALGFAHALGEKYELMCANAKIDLENKKLDDEIKLLEEIERLREENKKLKEEEAQKS